LPDGSNGEWRAKGNSLRCTGFADDGLPEEFEELSALA
jgi:hypothetical protein